MSGEPKGAGLPPAFDSNALIRQTQRILVTLWMEDAGEDVIVLPEVWRELTRQERTEREGVLTSAERWRRIREMDRTPFRFIELSKELDDKAYQIRKHFTESCFKGLAADEIDDAPDPIIVSQALALGTDILVSSDRNSVVHDEVNHIAANVLGKNAGFITTLDSALSKAYVGGESSERLLMLALAMNAPSNHLAEWAVDHAHDDLGRLRKALLGAGMPVVAERLEIRWEQCRDLDSLLERAAFHAKDSPALQWERLRGALGHSGSTHPSAATWKPKSWVRARQGMTR